MSIDSLVAFFGQAWHDYPAVLRRIAIVCICFFLLERLIPAERKQPLRNILLNIRWLIVAEFVVLLVAPLATFAIASGVRLAGFRGLIHIPFDAHPWLTYVSPLVYLFIFDFFYYWCHRAQHVIPVLWEQHKVHHADESVNSLAIGRHHWTEALLRAPLVVLPMTLLFDMKPSSIGFIAVATSFWAYFKHANLRLPLGPLTPVFTGPQLHRIHHSRAAEHLDKNYAAFFPVYDLLFGTYYKPRPGEYPPTGLNGSERLDTAWKLFVAPFSGWKRIAQETLDGLSSRRDGGRSC